MLGKPTGFKGPSSGPYVGAVGRFASYAVTTTEGAIEAISGSGWTDTAQRKAIHLSPHEKAAYARVLVVGERADTSSVVSVTAYDKYALEAFEAGAIDYLLKPVRQERLLQTIDRVRRFTGREAVERLARLQEIGAPIPLRQRLKKIVGKTGAEYFLLNTDEIFSFQAEGDLVWIFTARHKFLATQTLDALEERLRDSHFQRIHRNALVNVDHVRKIGFLSSQRWLLTMTNDQEFIASKRRARGLRQILDR